MNLFWSIVVFFLFITTAVVMVVFLRALSVRLMTGKWPHENERARAIYEKLP